MLCAIAIEIQYYSKSIPSRYNHFFQESLRININKIPVKRICSVSKNNIENISKKLTTQIHILN